MSITQMVCAHRLQYVYEMQSLETLRENFVANLETEKRRSGISQHELAQRVKVAATTLVRVKKPGEALNLDLICKIAAVFKKDPLSLLLPPNAESSDVPEVLALRRKVDAYQNVIAKLGSEMAPALSREDEAQFGEFQQFKKQGGKYASDLIQLWMKADDFERLSALFFLDDNRIDFQRALDEAFPDGRSRKKVAELLAHLQKLKQA